MGGCKIDPPPFNLLSTTEKISMNPAYGYYLLGSLFFGQIVRLPFVVNNC